MILNNMILAMINLAIVQATSISSFMKIGKKRFTAYIHND